MPETAESLLLELEQILGLTLEEAATVDLGPIEEHAPKWATLVDTYRSISDLARRELQSAYEYLFQLVGGVGAPVRYVTEAFAEEEQAPRWGQKRLFEDAREQFNELLGAHGYEREGESYLSADRLMKVLENVIQPPWWKPGYGSFHELDRNLETIIRLATPFRNAIGWAIANGHDGDERKQAQINKQVSILWIQHAWYEHTFAPEVRRRILYKDPSITSIAALIFDSSEYMGRRPVQTVAAATRLESPAREGALGILASALAVDILHSSGLGEQRVVATCKKLQPLMHYVVGQLLAKEKVERLNEWVAKAKIFPAYSRKDVEQQLGELAERLTNLESIVLRGERGKTERRERLAGLVKNILDFLHEETAHPRSRWLGESYSVVGNYCELLWENSVDEAFGPNGDADKYEEWQWLELRRTITELALGFRGGARFRGYGWKA